MLSHQLTRQPPGHADIAVVVDDAAEDVPGHWWIIADVADDISRPSPLFRGVTKIIGLIALLGQRKADIFQFMAFLLRSQK